MSIITLEDHTTLTIDFICDDDSITSPDAATLHQEFLRELANCSHGTIRSTNLLNRSLIRLDNIHQELGEAHAFVFMPMDGVDMALKLMSVFVGSQTEDRNLFLRKPDGLLVRKPVIVINAPGQKSGNDRREWDELLELIRQTPYIPSHLKGDEILHVIAPETELSPAQLANEVALGIFRRLDRQYAAKPPQEKPELCNKNAAPHYDHSPQEPEHRICVFCSASNVFLDRRLADPQAQDLAFQLGAALGKHGFGVVSGAGDRGMMVRVVQGAQSTGGWTAGSNTPHIVAHEGLPDGITAYADAPDIYKRMRMMIQGSSGFVIAPGGAGTIQEFLTLLHLKEHESELMACKPIVILSPSLEADPDRHYWDGLEAYALKHGEGDLFHVARSVEQAIAILQQETRAGNACARSWQEIVAESQRWDHHSDC